MVRVAILLPIAIARIPSGEQQHRRAIRNATGAFPRLNVGDRQTIVGVLLRLLANIDDDGRRNETAHVKAINGRRAFDEMAWRIDVRAEMFGQANGSRGVAVAVNLAELLIAKRIALAAKGRRVGAQVMR